MFSDNPAQKLLKTLLSANHFIWLRPFHDQILLRQKVGGEVLGRGVAREWLEDALIEGAECGFDLSIVLDDHSWGRLCWLFRHSFWWLLPFSPAPGGYYNHWFRKILLRFDAVSALLLLSSIVQEDLESLVDQFGFLFWCQVPRFIYIASTKHVCEVERETSIFELLRPIAVVAAFGRLFM